METAGGGTAAEVSRLLVLGSDAGSKAAVLAKLRELSGQSASSAGIAAADVVSLLNLRTKYYRARLEVHAHQVLDNEPVRALAHELHEYEALLCVVDSSARGSFLHVQRLAKRIVDTLPYEVCLLVASSPSDATAKRSVEAVQEMMAWCQENAFEFVDLDDDGEHEAQDDGVNETRGIERVLEALHCNMWRSMEMTPRADAQASASSTAAMASSAEEPTQPAQEESEAQQKEIASVSSNQTDEQQPSDSSNGEEDRSTDDSRLQTLLQALEIAGAPDDASTSASMPARAAGAGEDEDEDDVDMREFSALLSQVRDVRENGGALTDEERRKRAAEVAMKLWSFLGADESDADDADDSD